MARRIHVTGVPRQKPEIGLYVLALIALARQMQEQGRKPEPPTPGASAREEVADE
ncbi:hypothetical protein ND748_02875 [Frankia sp. AiPs1]|uniref:hypothetical protein n=1 Tax=Frankia sp. AiPs1 TaxID=573493 RepID=UPI00204334D6|nr:hypothetical protein [Frankia sp. AiPs1]MCM3920624.1 hypothetical protein [Frankia sp. AiPs1]